jgi:hypothetical protein
MCSQWSSKQRIRLNLPISAFYPHFSVLSPFQFPLSVSVSAIRFQRFIPTHFVNLIKMLFEKNMAKQFLKEGSKGADVNEGKFVLNIDVLFAL